MGGNIVLRSYLRRVKDISVGPSRSVGASSAAGSRSESLRAREACADSSRSACFGGRPQSSDMRKSSMRSSHQRRRRISTSNGERPKVVAIVMEAQRRGDARGEPDRASSLRWMQHGFLQALPEMRSQRSAAGRAEELGSVLLTEEEGVNACSTRRSLV